MLRRRVQRTSIFVEIETTELLRYRAPTPKTNDISVLCTLRNIVGLLTTNILRLCRQQFPLWLFCHSVGISFCLSFSKNLAYYEHMHTEMLKRDLNDKKKPIHHSSFIIYHSSFIIHHSQNVDFE